MGDSTGRSEGNAVIAVKDIKGNIVWSWHIWVCNDEITAHDHIDSEGKVAAVIMDRNLGALNNTPMDVGNRGMFYEWGRKDPFTPSRSPYHTDTDGNNVPAYNEPNTAIGDGTGTWVYNAQAAVLATPPANIPNSILNPMTYLQSPYNGHADWYCTGTDPKATHPGLWGPEKTIFDPCPPGYKVPGPDLWGIPAGNNSITNGGAAADYDETGVSAKWDWNAYEDCGRRWKNTGDFYPMAGNIYYTDYIYNIGDSISIRDHNWRSGGYGVMTCRQALTHKSNVAMFKILLVNRGDNAFGIWKKMTSDEKQTNAMELAALFNGAYQKNTLTFPTLQGDSVTEETFDNITPLGRKYLQEVLIGLNKGKGIQASYAPKKVDIAGVYGNYQGKELENGEHKLAETAFVGVFPVKKPRYALAVIINRPNEQTHGPKDLANGIVNNLVEWLSKY